MQNVRTRIIGSLCLAILCLSAGRSQLRDYRIHERGMLHQTEFNTGELGRGYDNGGSGSRTGVPSFEWPSNSAVFITQSYNGQYNSLGAGLYMSGNLGTSSTRISGWGLWRSLLPRQN